MIAFGARSGQWRHAGHLALPIFFLPPCQSFCHTTNQLYPLSHLCHNQFKLLLMPKQSLIITTTDQGHNLDSQPRPQHPYGDRITNISKRETSKWRQNHKFKNQGQKFESTKLRWTAGMVLGPTILATPWPEVTGSKQPHRLKDKKNTHFLPWLILS